MPSTLSKINSKSTKRNVATSDWIQIYRTPSTSKLSDLFPSLNQIIDYELQKGIIDLDIVLQDPRYFDSHARVNALKEVDALDTLYPTRQIDTGKSNIPLWSLEEFSPDIPDPLDVTCPMILEARIHLSYHARPMGWFLRLPSRSVVHAVLNHVRRADHDRWHSPNEGSKLKQRRKEWREGLWKRVYAEYESAAAKREVQMALEHEDCDETKLMWGDGKFEDESTDESSFMSESMGGSEFSRTLEADEPEEDAVDYIQRYSQCNPYLVTQNARQESPYHFVRSGSTILNVREFSPYPFDVSSFRNEYLPWEQHAFHLSPHLNLSDSVVRVETSDLTASENDIQFFFRGYDLKGIPVKRGTTPDVPSCFMDFPQSIGWAFKEHGNVDLLVEGIHTPQYNHPSDRKDGKPIRANKHTFLVRLASSADARMAIRDKDGKMHEGGHRWSVSPYPNTK